MIVLLWSFTLIIHFTILVSRQTWRRWSSTLSIWVEISADLFIKFLSFSFEVHFVKESVLVVFHCYRRFVFLAFLLRYQTRLLHIRQVRSAINFLLRIQLVLSICLDSPWHPSRPSRCSNILIKLLNQLRQSRISSILRLKQTLLL